MRKATARARLKARWKSTASPPASEASGARAPAISGRKGSASTQPRRRLARLPTGRRRASRSPEAAARSGLRALPRLAPSTMARAATGVTRPASATEAMTSTAAMLECMAQVSRAMTTRTGSGSRVAVAISSRACGPTAPGAKVSTRRCRARRTRPRPIPARPRLRVRARLPVRKARRPAKIRAGKTSVMSKASAQVTSAVPTLAPSMTESAGTSPMTPPARNDVAIMAVAVLLCSASVTPAPARSARSRLRRARPSRERRSPPKARSTPLWTMCTPQRRRATSPRSSISACVAGMACMPAA